MHRYQNIKIKTDTIKKLMKYAILFSVGILAIICFIDWHFIIFLLFIYYYNHELCNYIIFILNDMYFENYDYIYAIMPYFTLIISDAEYNDNVFENSFEFIRLAICELL
jgi:hypothetical protein